MNDRERIDVTGTRPSRAAKTIAWYRKRGPAYVAQVRRELNDPHADLATVVDHFLTSDDRYKPASRRAMQAWLLQMVDDAIAEDPANGELREVAAKIDAGCGPAFLAQLRRELGDENVKVQQLVEAFLVAERRYTARAQKAIPASLVTLINAELTNGTLSATERERLLHRLNHNKPKPKPTRRKKNTSAKKRKNAPFNEMQRVVKYLSPRENRWNFAASEFLKLNINLGLRPSEWRTAYLKDSTFYWTAEKTTNGRGNAKNPHVRLNNLESWGGTLRSFLEFIKPYRDDDEQWLRLIDRLRSRIAYACEKLGVERISPYTTRNVFIANQLLLGTDPAEVAAMVNHKLTRTQRRHYASKLSGYQLSYSLVSAPPELIATVERTTPFSFDKLRGSLFTLSP